MRAATISDDGDGRRVLVVDVVDDPTPGPTDIVVEVSSCGICGSDLKMVDHLPHGYVMGHEFCGRAVAIGTDVRDFGEGDLVVALPVTGCGRCGPCLAGEYHHCLVDSDQYGVGGRHGAYAQYARVDARQAFALPDDVPIRNGALVEPLAVGVHALSAARLRPDDAVLVVGGGPVGIACAAAARLLGAGEVVVSEPLVARRSVAQLYGAATVDPGAGDVAGQFATIAGRAPDVVVEAVGSPGMIQHCLDVAATKGRVVVAGVGTQPESLLPFVPLLKEVTVTFAVFYRRADFAAALRMLARGDFDPDPLVSDEIDLEALPSTFAALRTPERAGGANKVLVVP